MSSIAEIRGPGRDDIMPAVDLYSDFLFAFPAYRAVFQHIIPSSYPLYFYYFSTDTELNFIIAKMATFRQLPGWSVGAAHRYEIGYIFKPHLLLLLLTTV